MSAPTDNRPMDPQISRSLAEYYRRQGEEENAKKQMQSNAVVESLRAYWLAAGASSEGKLEPNESQSASSSSTRSMVALAKEFPKVTFGPLVPIVAVRERDDPNRWAFLHVLWSKESATSFWVDTKTDVKCASLYSITEIQMDNDLLFDLQKLAPDFGGPMDSFWLDALQHSSQRTRAFRAVLVRMSFTADFDTRAFGSRVRAYTVDN